MAWYKKLQVPIREGGARTFLINDDIRPLPPSRRQWTKLYYISFWAMNQICLSNWQVGAGLVATGLSVWQVVVAVVIGKIITAMVAVANGMVGGVWHIGFPVTSRFVWGLYGSYLAMLQRILLGLIWFGVQSWTGGLSVSCMLGAIFPSYQNMRNTLPASANMTTKEFTGYIVYNLLIIPLLYIPPERMRKMLLGMNIVVFVTLMSMMIYILSAAHGAGPLLSKPATVQSGSQLAWAIMGGIQTVIGSIAVGLTNQPDYSRFAKSPGDQIFGQYFSITLFGVIMPFFGCLTTSATIKLYGEAIWNPPNIALRWLEDNYSSGARAGAFFCGLGFVVCQLAINTVDNAFSFGMDTAALFPKYINIRRGAYIGLVLSIALTPWNLLATATTFINVMSAYSVFLGPMVGIMIFHYFFVVHQKVKLSDLFTTSREGIYYYWYGFNWRAFVAWVIGFAPQLPGFINAVNPSIKVPQACVHMFQICFKLGFAISFFVYYLINRFFPPRGAGEFDAIDYFNTFTEKEAAALGVMLQDDAIVDNEDEDDIIKTQ